MVRHGINKDLAMLRYSLLAFVATISLAFNVAVSADDQPQPEHQPLPLHAFAQLPDVSRLLLSPEGDKLAATVRVAVEDTVGTAVQVTDLDGGEQNILLFTDNSRYFINSLTWKDNKTLLVSTFYPDRRDTWVGMGQARFQTREGRLLIVDTESGEVSNPFSRAFLRRFRILPSSLNQVVDTLPDDPDHILMALPGTRGGPYNVVYKVNIHNQKRRIVHNSEPNIYGWQTDRQGVIRAGHYFQRGVLKTRILDPQTDKWRDLWPHGVFSEDYVRLAGFGYDPNEVYIRAYHEGRLALFKVDLRDPDLTRELVLSHPVYDVGGGLIYSREHKQVIGVRGFGDSGTQFFNPEMQSLQKGIDAAMPNTRNYITSLSDDTQTYLVYSNSPTESGTYYLGQRDPAKIEAVAYSYRQLTPDVLSETQRHVYSARDGLEIEAWLTLPNNTEAKNLPAIMLPHGGPHLRDSGHFDPWAQFLASRGYAVLQMNFRGSAGQGIEFRNAGLQNWGKEMQDDIQDGAKYLIEKGIADPDRICIAGGSYGGYAALMGVVKTPDFYQCAVSINGVSNVFDLVRDNRAFWSSYNVVDEQVGPLGAGLRKISPVNHADKIEVPVLLVHGEHDRQVELKHSEQMRDALEREEKDVSFLVLPNDDHFLSSEQNRIAAFEAMAAFLEKHLPVTKDEG